MLLERKVVTLKPDKEYRLVTEMNKESTRVKLQNYNGELKYNDSTNKVTTINALNFWSYALD